MDVTSIGNRIKKIRELKNLTQEHMAEKIGVSQSTYGRFENDITELTISKLEKIAESLGCTLDDIFNFDRGNFLQNTNHSGNINSPNSIVNDKYLIEELIKAKDKIIFTLELNVALLEQRIDYLTKEK